MNECNEEALEISSVARTRKIDECAAKCKGVAPIFAFGTNDFGGNGCNEGLCKCKCIFELNDNKCQITFRRVKSTITMEVNYNDYWFFKFKEKFEPSGKQC